MRVPVSSVAPFAAVLGGLVFLAATPALACSGRALAGETISGPVLAVPTDGVICVAQGPRPTEWAAVRLEGGAAIDRKLLMAAAFSRRVVCVLTAAGRGRCSLDGADIASLAQTPTVQQAAVTWR